MIIISGQIGLSQFIMSGKQQLVRDRIVSFVQRHKGSRDDWRVYTVNHFIEEGVPRRTVYRVIGYNL